MTIVAWVILFLAGSSLVLAAVHAILIVQGRHTLPVKTLVVMFSAFAIWIALGGLVVVAWVLQYDYRWLSAPRQVSAAYMQLMEGAVRYPFWRWFRSEEHTSEL